MNSDVQSSTSQFTLPNDYSNRVVVFKELTIDQMSKEINNDMFESLLDTHYDKFIEMCEEIKLIKDDISSITCILEDGNLKFDITKK